MVVNEGQMVCVELVAKNPLVNESKVLFLGSIKYEALRKVYETRVNSHENTYRIFDPSISGYNKYSNGSTNVFRNVHQTTSRIRSNAWP